MESLDEYYPEDVLSVNEIAGKCLAPKSVHMLCCSHLEWRCRADYLTVPFSDEIAFDIRLEMKVEHCTVPARCSFHTFSILYFR